MTRDEYIAWAAALVDEGERIGRQPSLAALRTWLKLSDELLSEAWGSMDRYHLAWLMVGKPREIVRGRPMTPAEEARYVREVAEQKTAALRMSLDAVERQGMPFLGEKDGIGPGQGMGAVPRAAPGAGLGHDDELSKRLRAARAAAEGDVDHDAPRAPRPDRMQR